MLALLLVALVVMVALNRELRLVRKIQRAALPVNHPQHRPLTRRERVRVGWP